MKKESKFTFLTKKQIFSYDGLGIIKKYGKTASITDFAILLGGYVSDCDYTSEGNTRKDRTCSWWTKSNYYRHDSFGWEQGSRVDNHVYIAPYRQVNPCVGYFWSNVYQYCVCARPAIPYSSIKSRSLNEMTNAIGIKEVEYGEYPQTIVNESFSCELDEAYDNGSLEITGKDYTTDSAKDEKTDTNFKARTHIEYEYKGSKYIRFVADSNSNGKILSDGRIVKSGNVYWIHVEPITWLVDKISDIALSKKALFSGVQFDNHEKYSGDFKESNIYQFMNNYFAKDIKKRSNIQVILNKIKKKFDKKNKSQEEIEMFDKQQNQQKQENKKTEKTKKSTELSDKELSKQDKSERKKILKEIRKEVVKQSHNQEIYMPSEKKKHK